MHSKKNKYSPIAIGGLGGSGTRVVAEILNAVGFYLGNDLNPALDNLSFSLLLKRPKWFIKNNNKSNPEISKGIRIFETAMTQWPRLKFEDYGFIMKAAMQWSIFGNHFGGIGKSGRGIWPFKRAMRMVCAKNPDLSQFQGWAWKEPNTHIYLDYLAEYFENFKYIHVVRHGLDMAFSRNQVQLYNWGQVLGVDGANSAAPLPKRALDFWIKANERAVAIGKQFPQGKFLAINFDELCRNPGDEVKRLINFLQIKIQEPKLKNLEQMPQKPKSSGRYKNEDLSIFSQEEIQAVQKFGFRVDA